MSTKTKEEFIVEMFPNVMKVDPYLDQRFIYQVTLKLVEYKYHPRYTPELEERVLNLILRIQKSFKYRRAEKPRSDKREEL